MKNYHLYIFFGPSGCGKSAILEAVLKDIPNSSIHQKETTRPPRRKESGSGTADLKFVDSIDTDNSVLIYSLYGHDYSVREDLILKAIEGKENHFVIVNDIDAVKKMKEIYLNATTIFVHSNPQEIPERFFKRDTLDDFDKRKKRIKNQYDIYIKNLVYFDYVILNLWRIDEAVVQLKEIVKYIDKK